LTQTQYVTAAKRGHTSYTNALWSYSAIVGDNDVNDCNVTLPRTS